MHIRFATEFNAEASQRDFKQNSTIRAVQQQRSAHFVPEFERESLLLDCGTRCWSGLWPILLLLLQSSSRFQPLQRTVRVEMTQLLLTNEVENVCEEREDANHGNNASG